MQDRRRWLIEEYPKIMQSSNAKQVKNIKYKVIIENKKCRCQETSNKKKRRSIRVCWGERRVSVSTQEVRQWFSKGPIDRHVHSFILFSFPLSPSNQSLHHRVSRLRTLSCSPCGECLLYSLRPHHATHWVIGGCVAIAHCSLGNV